MGEEHGSDTNVLSKILCPIIPKLTTRDKTRREEREIGYFSLPVQDETGRERERVRKERE